MIELIALIFLCKKNGELAFRKGLSPGKWKWYTVAGWFTGEMLGLFLGMVLLGSTSLPGILALGLVSAFGGYLYIKALLDKMPDDLGDDVDKIGINDLRPPNKTNENQ